MIKFNIPPATGKELTYIRQAMESQKICGDGSFTKKCHTLLTEKTGAKHALLTTSCTSALEMAAILANIEPGDEVIMPSFTFSSTADAFVLRGATIVFVDIRPDTMNIDEQLIESAITPKTKAVCVMHYAGVACQMEVVTELCQRYKLVLIEDAAQAVNAFYHDRMLGTIGDYGCYSFHETKNYSMGEGGAILINNDQMEMAEIIREKGTDRSRFLRGQVDKYTWVEKGGSYLPSDILAAYLLPQLEEMDQINQNRLNSWQKYYQLLKPLADAGYVQLPTIPDGCRHNAHMFYIKTKNIDERSHLIEYLQQNEIQAVYHYIPLHSAPAGLKYGRFAGDDRYTTIESERLLRLPMYYNLTDNDIITVCKKIIEFYNK
ncbi:MAG: dTDP-4-amino-4,6-dideoxygalactose transaminase [Erysipelotrichaceae bacterium]|nr:dTDP-4-amino-4,6-dideoxygalactose transaminase [Erysipelotrichaceae bacterium]